MRFFKWLKSLFKKKKVIEPNVAPTPVQRDRPSNSDEDISGYYPGAVFFDDLAKLKTPYSFGKWPKMYVVHFTAGWQNQTGRAFMESFLKRGLCTDFLDEKGQIFQQRDGNRGGYHAGTSSWKGKSNISKYAPGLEIACGGKLKEVNGKLYTWFKKEVPKKDARYVKKSEGYIHSGWYEKFTLAQEESLAEFLAWQIRQGVSEIVGHDGIAPNRKNDPGGSLSLPLHKFVGRKVLPLV